MAYDRVENWYDAQPEGVSEEALMAHAALYLAWLAQHGLVAPDPDNEDIDADLAARRVTPLDWYWDRFANSFYPEDLTPAGQRFTETYYVTGYDAEVGEADDLGRYFDDYSDAFPTGEMFDVAGNWADFDRLAQHIAARHADFVRGELT
jgi:hypothetical protein